MTMDKKTKLLRLPKVLDRIGLSRSTVYLMIGQDKFPKPIKLGDRAIAWDEIEIDKWIENKISNHLKELKK